MNDYDIETDYFETGFIGLQYAIEYAYFLNLIKERHKDVSCQEPDLYNYDLDILEDDPAVIIPILNKYYFKYYKECNLLTRIMVK